MKKFCAGALLVCLTLVMILSGCDSSKPVSNTKMLRVGVVDNLYNFSFYNEKATQYSGIAVDVANEIAKRIDYGQVRYVAINSETREEKLLNGEIDCIVTTMTITDERKDKFDFSTPFYTDNFEMLIENTTGFKKIDDLKGKTIGTMSTNTMKNELIKMYGENNIKIVTDADFSVLDKKLEIGEVDALFLDGCVAGGIINENRQVIYKTSKNNNYGVVTKKGSELSKPIDDAVQSIMSDGTMTDIIDKWD